MTPIRNKMYRVIKARKTDYLDYKEFCVQLPTLMDGIHLSTIDGLLQVYFGSNYRHLQSIFEFTRTMLAMKALRTFTCSKKTFDDCIIDFINYKRLCEKALDELCYNNYDVKIYLDPKIFNPLLNDKKIDIDLIKFIIKKEFKDYMMSRLFFQD